MKSIVRTLRDHLGFGMGRTIVQRTLRPMLITAVAMFVVLWVLTDMSDFAPQGEAERSLTPNEFHALSAVRLAVGCAPTARNKWSLVVVTACHFLVVALANAGLFD